MKHWIVSALMGLSATTASAGELTLAVASNFLTTAEALVQRFEGETGHGVTLAHGSTGQLYAQIDLGAPYDIYLAADAERPARLLAEGKAEATRTYALGRLVLAARLPVTVETAPEALVGKTVALADPTVAPYGKAATRAMERLALDTATFRPVLVANVGQVASVFATGNADVAFVAASQLPRIDAPHVLELDGLVEPVQQDAALLVQGGENDAARAFWDWLASEAARAVIADADYDLPPA